MHLLRRGWEDAQKSLQEAQKGFQERLQEDTTRRQGCGKAEAADSDHKPLDTLMRGFEDLRTTLQPLAGSKLEGLRSTFQNSGKRTSGHGAKVPPNEDVPFEQAWAAYCAKNPRLRDPKVLKQLVRRGVPDDRRAELWRHCLGVEVEAAKGAAVAALEAANRLPLGSDGGSPAIALSSGELPEVPIANEKEDDNEEGEEKKEEEEEEEEEVVEEAQEVEARYSAAEACSRERRGGEAGEEAACEEAAFEEVACEEGVACSSRKEEDKVPASSSSSLVVKQTSGPLTPELSDQKAVSDDDGASQGAEAGLEVDEAEAQESENEQKNEAKNEKTEANKEGEEVGEQNTKEAADAGSSTPTVGAQVGATRGEVTDRTYEEKDNNNKQKEEDEDNEKETEGTAAVLEESEAEAELQSKSSCSFCEPECKPSSSSSSSSSSSRSMLELVGGLGRVAKGVNEQIEVDVLRTLPYDRDFQEMGGPNMLRRVLRSLAALDLELGYCQSMNFLAATFLLVFRDEALALHAVRQLLMKLNTRCWYTDGMLQLRGDTIVLEGLIKERLPQVDAVLRRYRFDLLFLTSKWFMCLFSTVLQGETLKRVWDTMLSDGIETVFRISLAMLHLGSEQIVRTSTHDDLIFLFQGWDLQVEPKVLISAAYDPQVVGTLSRSELSQRRKEAATKVTAVDARDVLRSSRASRGGRRRG